MKMQDLPVKLTEIEMEAKAQQLVDLMDQKEKKDAEFAQLRKRHNDQMAEMTFKISVLARQRREGTELRPVQTAEVPDYHERKVETVRQDTGEVIGSRPLTQADRQQDLLGGAGPTS